MRCFRIAAAAAAAAAVSSSDVIDVIVVVAVEGDASISWLSSEDKVVDDIIMVLWDIIVPFDKSSNTWRRDIDASDNNDRKDVDVVVIVGVRAFMNVIVDATRQ
jgi:hypothetical protein